MLIKQITHILGSISLWRFSVRRAVSSVCNPRFFGLFVCGLLLLCFLFFFFRQRNLLEGEQSCGTKNENRMEISGKNGGKGWDISLKGLLSKVSKGKERVSKGTKLFISWALTWENEHQELTYFLKFSQGNRIFTYNYCYIYLCLWTYLTLKSVICYAIWWKLCIVSVKWLCGCSINIHITIIKWNLEKLYFLFTVLIFWLNLELYLLYLQRLRNTQVREWKSQEIIGKCKSYW